MQKKNWKKRGPMNKGKDQRRELEEDKTKSSRQEISEKDSDERVQRKKFEKNWERMPGWVNVAGFRRQK